MKDGQWWDVSWNSVTGCTPVSEGCSHCWARGMVKRFPGLHCDCTDEPSDRNDFSIIHTHPARLDAPLHWRKSRRVFVCSLGDLFHEDVPFEFVAAVLARSVTAIQHTYLILTKRPQRALDFWRWNDDPARSYRIQPELPNIYWGVTAENQARADERIPILLQIPAAKKFVSIEPMLGPVDLGFPVRPCALDGRPLWPCQESALFGLDWVIVGGETGPGARPMQPEWVRSLRDQCQEARMPFWLKSLGPGKGRKLDGWTWEECP